MRWMHDRDYGNTMLFYPQKWSAALLPSGVPAGKN